MGEVQERNLANQVDVLIHEIFKAQPNLFSQFSIGADAGKVLGDFIAALRQRLIGIYRD